jgi:hypothetical protein
MWYLRLAPRSYIFVGNGSASATGVEKQLSEKEAVTRDQQLRKLKEESK